MGLDKRSKIDPLLLKSQIVNPDGTPTEWFMRQWLAQRGTNVVTAEEAASALTAAQAADAAASSAIAIATALSNTLVGGDGTDIGPAAAPLSAGNVILELTGTGVTPNTYGDANNVARVTIDAKGRVTHAENVPVSGGGGGGGLSAPLANGDVPVALIDDGEGQTITVPLAAGAGSKIGTYLGVGIIADRPAAPAIPTGGLALYWATDITTLSAYDGSTWADI